MRDPFPVAISVAAFLVQSVVAAPSAFVHTVAKAENPNHPEGDGYQHGGRSRLYTVQVPPSSKLDSVWARIEQDVNTECKTCPYPQCTNMDWYGSSFMFRATCWTNGGLVNSTRLWLKSEQGCYVTEFDTINYWREYIEDLPYCGYVPEKGTRQRTSSSREVECKICPNTGCETLQTYQQGASVYLICSAQTLSKDCITYCSHNQTSSRESEGSQTDLTSPRQSTSQPEWYKTTSNCYVNASSFENENLRSQVRKKLETCGPVPYLEMDFHRPVNSSQASNSSIPPSSSALLITDVPPTLDPTPLTSASLSGVRIR